jgi:Family of unknown function (DUF6174)
MAGINKAYLTWAVIITLFLTSGIAIFANRKLFLNTPTHELTAAKKKWAAQNITHYRLTLNYSIFNNCQQEVEIKDDKVIAVKQNTCSTIPLQTMTHLFSEIESAANGEKCGPNGCACDGPVRIDANYDAKYGYPNQLDFKLKPEQRWQYFDYWKNQLSGGACTLVGFVGNKITVSAFTPIQ